MSVPGRRAHGLYAVGLVAIAVGLVAGTLVVLGSSGESISCAQFPSCLLAPATWVGAVHVIAAGLLLILTIAMIALALGLRREDARLWPLSVGAFLVLVGMASLGAAFAAGALPLVLAPIQLVFLGALIALIAWVSARARRISCAAHRAAA